VFWSGRAHHFREKIAINIEQSGEAFGRLLGCFLRILACLLYSRFGPAKVGVRVTLHFSCSRAGVKLIFTLGSFSILGYMYKGLGRDRRCQLTPARHCSSAPVLHVLDPTVGCICTPTHLAIPLFCIYRNAIRPPGAE
jgi:hypothetical protein